MQDDNTSDLVSIIVADMDVSGAEPTTTSLQVAKRFKKQHSHVLRSIRRLVAALPDEQQSTFGLSFKDTIGNNGATKRQPYYYITRDGFSLLAMGFTGKEALQWKIAYIAAFNRMAATLSRYVSFGVPGDLYARAMEAEKREAASFSRASVAGRALSLRRKEKKVFQSVAALVREEVQLRLLLGNLSD